MNLFGWAAVFAIVGALTLGIDMPWSGVAMFFVAVCVLAFAMYMDKDDA